MKEMYGEHELEGWEDAERIPAQQIKIKISKDEYALIDVKEGGLLKFSDVNIHHMDKRKREEKYQQVELKTKAEKIEFKEEK